MAVLPPCLEGLIGIEAWQSGSYEQDQDVAFRVSTGTSHKQPSDRSWNAGSRHPMNSGSTKLVSSVPGTANPKHLAHQGISELAHQRLRPLVKTLQLRRPRTPVYIRLKQPLYHNHAALMLDYGFNSTKNTRAMKKYTISIDITAVHLEGFKLEQTATAASIDDATPTDLVLNVVDEKGHGLSHPPSPVNPAQPHRPVPKVASNASFARVYTGEAATSVEQDDRAALSLLGMKRKRSAEGSFSSEQYEHQCKRQIKETEMNAFQHAYGHPDSDNEV
ncbi:hypothetical protein Micbo1qcDRAFT_181311 [Microdochium bolleyi]|uniref:Uncharacterized protein n=1 Tax=Microdochium bolleyi TaxID=196109 RepID=A0A136IIP0_9PEZI|nr:hypothetical protein Micbo1qcDRAFT_181311 [Microdochium bolleyi]